MTHDAPTGTPDADATWVEEGERGRDIASAFDSSPLWMVAEAPALNELMAQLQHFRDRYNPDAGTAYELLFSERLLAAAREQFATMIRRGEAYLHTLCDLLAHRLLESYRLRSVVIGEVAETRERFTLGLDISHTDVFANTDLDLGNRTLGRLRFADGSAWRGASLVSNVVEYQALSQNQLSIYRILSRIKAEEEIWNKVVDELFDIDRLVLRDKELRRFSRYVKDVFGIKIVVGDAQDVYRVQKALAGVRWGSELIRYHLTDDEAHRRLHFVEVKNYLAESSRKRTGWSAMKSVVRWADRTFEIQVQPLGNFLRERELLTMESHASFRAKREQVREEVGLRLPLFRFYRDLLRWLFLGDGHAPPEHVRIKVVRRP